MHKFLLFLLFILLALIGFGQERGQTSYQFLDLPVSARLTGLGGHLISVKDGDPSLAAANPSLLNSRMDNKMVMSYMNYFAGLNYGYTSYTHATEKSGTMNVGLKYLSYGSFDETDETGLNTGSFNAGEYALIFGWGRAIDSSFSIGANFKTIYSVLYTEYTSVALAVDLSATYTLKESRFAIAFLVKNIGREVVSYRKDDPSDLPFEIQLGISKQLENMPMRFSMVAHHLNQTDLNYDSPLDNNESTIQFNETEEKKENTFAGNVFRHLVFNAEFIPSKNFNVRIGYDINRRKEMAIDSKPGTVGFSWGFGFKISKFHLSYGRSAYHLSGSPNHFTLVTRLSDFYGNKG